MARITTEDTLNHDFINLYKRPIFLYCKLCGYKMYNIKEAIHYKGYNCVCKDCIRNMTDIFELSESDLEDIITNAGRDLAKGIEQ